MFGLVFASYLVKIGRIGGARKPAKASKGLPMSPTKDFAEVVNRNQGAATHRTQGTTSDQDGKDENDRLL